MKKEDMSQGTVLWLDNNRNNQGSPVLSRRTVPRLGIALAAIKASLPYENTKIILSSLEIHGALSVIAVGKAAVPMAKAAAEVRAAEAKAAAEMRAAEAKAKAEAEKAKASTIDAK